MRGILFDHIAIGTSRMADAPAVLVGALGGVPAYGQPSGVFRWGLWTFDGGGAIEILEPMGADGFLHRFLEQRGPGIHHVTFKVPDLRAAIERAARFDYPVVGVNDLQPAWKEAFLHPKRAQGIVVQLAEAHPELEPEEWTAPAFPAAPAPAREQADVRGLLLQAASEADARRQWQELLGGQCEAGPHGLVFRWPESPLAIRVAIDASRPPGPLGIEIATPRRLHFPEPGQRALGTRWLASPPARPR
jgi:methylmalonyl-CoA/ethylmalonyl-CoA epimerase